jgi:DNA-binding transcriptional ArsR family regulator
MARTGRPSCLSAILEALPGTIAQVARRSGKSPSSAGKWLGILNAERVVYLSKWVQRRNGPVPFYRLRIKESSVDAPKPVCTEQDYQQRYNERHPHRRAEIRAAYEQRQKEVMEKRRQRLAAWASPLTVVVSKQVLSDDFQVQRSK